MVSAQHVERDGVGQLEQQQREHGLEGEAASVNEVSVEEVAVALAGHASGEPEGVRHGERRDRYGLFRRRDQVDDAPRRSRDRRSMDRPGRLLRADVFHLHERRRRQGSALSRLPLARRGDVAA